ncbi:YcxB family protein [uncultured Bartonella sp.]|uniref:YcxB family protein n=1 Tax=uncultured Bartonella sp. TaxID=104108 RepID=UPI002610405C|nr:YcxB family protein [uncultured Bartonella sp.]
MTRQIVFTLDKQEALDALKAHYRSHALTRKTFLRLFFLWICSIAVMSIILVIIDGAAWFEHWGHSLYRISAIYAIIIISIWILNYFVLISRHAQQIVKADKQIGLEQTWIWDDHAVAIRSSYIKGTYPFRLFYDWREYPTFIALYISTQKFNILPKSAMTEEQLDDLREILQREIKSPKK